MPVNPATKRILQEARELSRNPSPYHTAAPLDDSNLFEWHFTLAGPPDSPYASGVYHGRIILPPTYPMRPPMFRFLTPSGRFEINRDLCLSMSGFHEETWQPAWGIRTAITALRAFMVTAGQGQIGGMEATEANRKEWASRSRAWVCGRCCSKTNEAILKESVDAAVEMEGEQKAEAEIPPELRLGYREDLGQKEESSEKAIAEDTNTTTSNSPIQPPQTDPSNHPPPPASFNSQPSNTESPTPNPATTQPQVQHQIQQEISIPAPQPAQAVQQPAPVHSADAVPAWVDRAIFGVIIALVFMVLRKYHGSTY